MKLISCFGNKNYHYIPTSIFIWVLNRYIHIFSILSLFCSIKTYSGILLNIFDTFCDNNIHIIIIDNMIIIS